MNKVLEQTLVFTDNLPREVSLVDLGVLSLMSCVCDQSGFNAMEFQSTMKTLSWPFSQETVKRIVAAVSPTRKAAVVSDNELAVGSIFEEEDNNPSDPFVTESYLSALKKKYPESFVLKESTPELLNQVFLRKELEELLELESSDDEFLGETGSSSLFRKKLLTYHRRRDPKKSVTSQGVLLSTDVEGHYRHHCNVCKTQFTTKASCDRHLSRLFKRRDRVHVTAAKNFEDRFPDMETHAFIEMYERFPASIPCNPLKCGLLHVKMKNEARVSSHQKGDDDSDDRGSSSKTRRTSLADKQEERYQLMLRKVKK